MNFTAFAALVRRDLRLFFMDRRAVVMSFVAPILIASFFGYLFGGVTRENAAKITVAAVDQDGSELSRKVIAALAAEPAFEVKDRSIDGAREQVRSGKDRVALVFPKGFGERAPAALFLPGSPPEIQVLFDPSHATEVQVVRGVLTQSVMRAIAGGFGRSINVPYTVHEEAMTARKGTPYNSMGHSFAGMCVQFILFMGIDAGMLVLYQRRTGMWKRLRAAPISRFTVIGSRAASATLVAMLIMLVVFGFARVVFGVKIEGSFAGFLGVCASFALMTAAFGLLVSVAGKTPEATRGIAILVTLVLVMLGGSWVPTFIFPQWLQKLTVAIPTRWAVDGLDGMIWRGLDFNAALWPIGVLLGFAIAFGAIAVWRFQWEG
jgi:linearmycin/streptolysin S transport system permease protein